MIMEKPGLIFIAFSLLLFVNTAALAQTLGTTHLLEGNSAGSDSVVLSVTPTNFPWTATTNASWLHLSAGNQSGAGSTNVVFTFDANLGATRTGTLAIAGQTLTVTQAGSTYVAANQVTTLVSLGQSVPTSVAVDGAGNVYIADFGVTETSSATIKQWTPASNTLSTLVSTGLTGFCGVAVDGVGNVYIADSGNSAIKKWTVASNTVSTLVSSGLNGPYSVAVDAAGNVYIADTSNNAIKEWLAVNGTVTTLVSSNLDYPEGVAVDEAGNVYIADFSNNTIKEWTVVNNTVTTLASASSSAVAVDGAGNAYYLDLNFFNNVIKEWTAASGTVTTLVSSGLGGPTAYGVAVDGTGNVYIADSWNHAIKELPRAFVDPTVKSETAFAGSDALPVVLPATANLTGPFAPVSDSPWLTLTGSANGVVSFAFTANPFDTSRTANISLLGQTIPVTQSAALVTPPNLTGLTILGNGAFQFGFTNNQGAAFTVLTTTNLLLPLTNWTVLSTLTNNGSGQYQFTDLTATNGGQRFYRVSSP